MGREQILELLRAHEQELKQAGIVHCSCSALEHGATNGAIPM